jgi:uncharacterized linocin/CFP29 family protein
MKKIPKSTLTSVSRAEWKNIQEKAIKVWHFERSPSGRGVIPVAGKFDPTNPNHIHQRKVFREHEV